VVEQHPHSGPAWRAEVFYGIVFLLLIVIGGGVAVYWRWADRQQAINPPRTVVQTGELTVTRRVEVDGAPYLIWSNGQVTPDMAEHRKFLLRTLAAQSLLQRQSEPTGR
jgi:hypothetical protein